MKKRQNSGRMFIMLNAAGIVCAVAGISYSLTFYPELTGILDRASLAPIMALLFPYLVITILWMVFLFRLKRSDMYDEKIHRDINKSGMMVFLVSLILCIVSIIKIFSQKPVVSPVYISGRLEIIWIVLYLFIAMLLFSVSALYNFKKN